jgi:hypothetical protein
MPKTPILSREQFYDVLGDGTFRTLDWCLVSTELGAMIESRPSCMMGFGINPMTNVDMIDFSFNKVSYFDEGKFFDKFNTSGYAFPKSLNLFDTYPIKPMKHS